MKIGVIIGRFQATDLHEGHSDLLYRVLNKHAKVLVLIGVRPSVPTTANPLAYSTRAAFFKRFPAVTTMPLLDTSANKSWSENVDRAIMEAFGPVNAVIYRGPNGFTGYVGRFPVETLDIKAEASGTKVRARAINDPLHVGSPAFTEGIIHAIGNLSPRTLLSVDMAMWDLYDENRYKIIMGRKHGESSYRFPGGMVEPGESFQRAAAREFMEEVHLAHLAGEKAWNIEGDFDIKDWRIADAPEINHKSVLMSCRYSHGIPRAGDDLEHVDWLDLEVSPDIIVPEHREMWNAMVEKFLGKVE